MKRLPLLLAPLLLASAHANDQVRDVQAVLKTQGFYYGEVTGAEGAETDAAIRRFQIRNGITVTGKLNAPTLAALGFAEKKTATLTQPPASQAAPPSLPPPAPKPVPQPAPAAAAPDVAAQKQLNPPAPANPAMPKPGEPVLPLKGRNDLLADGEAKDAAQKSARRAKAGDLSVVEPPSPVPPAVSTPFTTMLRDTPYANVPREVQVNVVRRAQAILVARHFYRGPLDGIAGPATSEAIFLFQDGAELRRTGRLDPETLAEMDLLPRAAQGNPLLKPFYNPNRRRDTSVATDYWIR